MEGGKFCRTTADQVRFCTHNFVCGLNNQIKNTCEAN
jgi:hypothetical protein